MSISGGLRFDFPDGREPVHFRFVINDADAEILRQFSAAAQTIVALTTTTEWALNHKKCQPTTVSPVLTNDINIDTITLCQH